MARSTVAIMASLGALITSLAVFLWVPVRGADAQPIQAFPSQLRAGSDPSMLTLTTQDLSLQARMGHARIASQQPSETYLMIDLQGRSDERSHRDTAPTHLSIVIDRSGSMAGTRISNAIEAAVMAVNRLSDGDRVSVVTFDTNAQTVVYPTTLNTSTRAYVTRTIRAIQLGDNTCISCGISEAIRRMEPIRHRDDIDDGYFVRRMILLSDGEANRGTTDLDGFRRIGNNAREQGISIATVGVDVSYNEKILSTIAIESNGRHYFAPTERYLAEIFSKEAAYTKQTIATGTEIHITLNPGVELVRVYDRTFRKVGNQIIVPMGTMTSNEQKSVLLKLRIRPLPLGNSPVASIDMTYRSLLSRQLEQSGGEIGVQVTTEALATRELDSVVNARVTRSETASLLLEANDLYKNGQDSAAKDKITKYKSQLSQQATAARASAGPEKKRLDSEYENQLRAVKNAEEGFSAPKGSAGVSPAPAAIKRNQEAATDMAF